MLKEKEPFYDLINEEFNAINFVMDYVELHFNGKAITAYFGPILQKGDNVIEFPQDGSRDALCKLIGDVVVDIQYVIDKAVELKTKRGVKVTIPLDRRDSNCPEAFQYSDIQDVNKSFYI